MMIRNCRNLYGIVMPLLKRGIPVETVHMENLGFAENVEKYKGAGNEFMPI